MSLTFYCGSGSPFAWKVWLALEHKAIPYDLKVLSFDKGDTRAPDFRAINPRGKVPTIVDKGYALWESAVILEYLDEAYPERPLLPKDSRSRATARRIAAEAENYLGPVVVDLFRATLYREGPKDPERLTEVHDRLADEVSRFEAMLQGDHFTGDLSVADFTVMLTRSGRLPVFTVPRQPLLPACAEVTAPRSKSALPSLKACHVAAARRVCSFQPFMPGRS